MTIPRQARSRVSRVAFALVAGFAVGLLGGLIGLGGAEFRLPLLMGIFGFPALEAVIVNKAIGLLVVATSLASRSHSIPFDAVIAQWPVMATVLTGSLAGAWLGADWATRLSTTTHYRTIAALLVVIAVVLLTTHDVHSSAFVPAGSWTTALGVVAGFGIGVVASMIGVAGGELLIPTLVMLFGLEFKLAGSVSLAISLPTMLVGFARYSRNRAFVVLRGTGSLVLAMAIGSMLGAVAGGQLVRVVSTEILVPLLAVILVASAIQVWRHH